MYAGHFVRIDVEERVPVQDIDFVSVRPAQRLPDGSARSQRSFLQRAAYLKIPFFAGKPPLHRFVHVAEGEYHARKAPDFHIF